MADAAAIAQAGRTQQFATSFSNTTLHLIILPTEQCNFRCVYCYEDFSIGAMKPPVVNGVKRLLAERVPGLRQLHISWFGGEPLLALDIVKDIATTARELVAGNAGVAYTGGMTTNAYRLDCNTARALSDLGVRQYQVTLDGPPAFHDQTRVRRDGGGSFERIWSNLLDIRDSDLALAICLRVHVTAANLPVMPDFLARVRREFLGDARFSLQLKAVGRWGGPNDETLPVLEGDERASAVDRLGAQVLAGLPASANFEPGDICYASRPNSFVIRASGDVGKCTVALSDPANSIGRIREDGTLELRNSALRPWLRGWGANPDADALECPLIGLPRGKGEPVLLQISAGPTSAGRVDVTNSA
jgi:uncharacterized protein